MARAPESWPPGWPCIGCDSPVGPGARPSRADYKRAFDGSSMLLALLCLLAPEASAKDLRSKVGLGFHQQFGDVTALSLRFGVPAAKPTTNVQLEIDAGFELMADTDPTFFAGGRLLYGVVAEDNMNLYLGAGGGYALAGPDGFFRIQPVVGAQFFLFGLENLGFSVEWGVSVDLGDAWAVRTVGTAPNVAVHYYF